MFRRTAAAVVAATTLLVSLAACTSDPQHEIADAETAVAQFLEFVADGDVDAALAVFEEPTFEPGSGEELLASANERITNITVGAAAGLASRVTSEYGQSSTVVPSRWVLDGYNVSFEFLVSGTVDDLRISTLPDAPFMATVNLGPSIVPYLIAGEEVDGDAGVLQLFPGVYNLGELGPVLEVVGTTAPSGYRMPDRDLHDGGKIVANPSDLFDISISDDVATITELSEEHEAAAIALASERFDRCASDANDYCDFTLSSRAPVDASQFTDWQRGEPQIIAGPDLDGGWPLDEEIAVGCWTVQVAGPASVTTAAGTQTDRVYLHGKVGVSVNLDGEFTLTEGCAV